MDQSELDNKYFIDNGVYNCPFCKRRNVVYEANSCQKFDWTNEKPCYIYTVQCSSCGKVSMHLSYEQLLEYGSVSNGFKDDIDLDNSMLYHRPTSFFTLDSVIPSKVRELVAESEEALQFNLLTGASASLRKAIYTLLKIEKSQVFNESKKVKYAESIKALKVKFPQLDGSLINSLSHIQNMTSDSVHEDSWEAWDAKTLRFLLELSKAVLIEMYVEPQKRKQRYSKLTELSSKLQTDKKS